MNHKSEYDAKRPPAEPEFILGVPNQDVPPDDPLVTVTVDASPARERRTVEQWESLGVPDQTPETFEPVAPEESRLLSVEAPVVADEAQEPAIETNFLRELVGSPTVIATLILLTCLVLLAVSTQVMTLVTQLAMLTEGVRLVG
jgi:hypothetical protein